MESRYEGNVYYNNDDVVHIRSFENADGTPCMHDARTRFAYVVVSEAEALALVGSLKDNQAVLQSVKTKYTPMLLQAIEQEHRQVNQSLQLNNNEYIIEDKLIHLISIPASNASCEVTVLQGLGFHTASKNAPEEKKQIGKQRNISYLKKSIKECNTLVTLERNKVAKTATTNKDKRAYVLLSMPYVYNKVFNERGTLLEYERIEYKDHINISLRPKVKVEYGIFFDGTNNNMYNIDFFQDFKTYVTNLTEYMKENYKPFGADSGSFAPESYQTFAEYIATHPDPQKSTFIMNMLRNEIVMDIRYFQESSTQKHRFGTDKASKDADSVFDFLIALRRSLSQTTQRWYQRFTQKYGTINASEDEIETFITDAILPESREGSSYTNGYTNIKRLYEHYKGDDRLNPQADCHALKRFKLYASGSGTSDPSVEQSLNDDGLLGLSLGNGATGIEANVVYACKKIARQLHEAGIEYIDELIFDVFGFSRGAAQARHFVSSIQKEFALLNGDESYAKYCLNIDPEENNTDLFTPFFPENGGKRVSLAGKVFYNPLRKVAVATRRGKRTIEAPPLCIKTVSLRHLNIADTVSHHLFFQSNDYKYLNLDFDKQKIGSLYHITAMDEYRDNFDLYSVFENDYEKMSKKDENIKEVVVPGAHADVGGGYEHFGVDETVYLQRNITGKTTMVKQWNDVYGWLKNFSVYQAQSVDEIDKEGVYNIYDPYNPSTVTLHDIYMHRKNLSWYYELVTFRLMHSQAIDEDKEKEKNDRVPLKNIEDRYSLKKLKDNKKISEEDFNFLLKVYRTLSKEEVLSVADHKKLRQRFLHHSASLGIVNAPSYKGYEQKADQIYGTRHIYGATGNVFTKFPQLASKSAKGKW